MSAGARLFLEEVRRLIASAKPGEGVLSTIARLAVPAVADGFAVFAGSGSGEPSLVASHARDPVAAALASEGPACARKTARRWDETTARDGDVALVAVPLVARASLVGALVAAKEGPARSFSREDVRALQELALLVALVLEQELAQRDHRETQALLRAALERAEFLADASRVLASSLDLRLTLRRLLELGVPMVADWGVAYLVREDGSLERAHLHHRSPEKAALLAELDARYPEGPRVEGSPLAEALRDGAARLHQPVRPEELAAGARDARHLEIFHELGVGASLYVPLRFDGRSLGVLALTRGPGSPPFAQGDLDLARELCLRASIALDHAAVHAREARARRLAERSVEQLTLLQGITAALSAAWTPQEVAQVIAEPMRTVVGASTCMLYAREGGSLRLVHGTGLPSELLSQWADLPVDGPLPLAVAVRAAEAIYLRSPEELAARFPSVVARTGSRAWAILPLKAGDADAFGGFVLGFTREREFLEDDRRLLETLAQQGGQALFRARLLAELREKEERFQLVGEAVDEGIWEWDVRSEHAWRSASTEALFGYAPGELGGDDRVWSERIHPEDRERTARELDALLRSDARRGSTQYRFRRKDGTYATVLDRCAIVRDEKGAPLKLVGSMLDISRLKELEQAALLKRALLESQNEAALDGIFFQDEAGRVVSYNRRLLEMWNVPESVPQMRTLEERLAASISGLKDPQAFAQLAMALDKDQEGTRRLDLALKDGRIFDCYTAPVRDETGEYRGRVWFYRDVTTRRVAERELVEARRQLAQSEKLAAIGALVSGVAHEVRTPLAYVNNHAQLLARWTKTRGRGVLPPEDVARVEESTAAITEGVDRMNRLVQDLRRFVKLERVGEGTHVDEAALGALRLFEATHRAGVRLHTALGADALTTVDRVQLQQVVLNLLENAADASPPGAPVRLSTRLEDGFAFLRVEDDGPGIPPEVQERMWEPFFTTKPEGTGLGLSIVRRIAEQAGGSARCDSAPGAGTRFEIRLPATKR